MLATHIQRTLDDPITRHMRTEFARLQTDQTVGEALSEIRANPPASRVSYFYVVDDVGRVQGVVPVRRLLLSPLDMRVEEIMVREVITLLGILQPFSTPAIFSSCTVCWHSPWSTGTAASWASWTWNSTRTN